MTSSLVQFAVFGVVYYGVWCAFISLFTVCEVCIYRLCECVITYL